MEDAKTCQQYTLECAVQALETKDAEERKVYMKAAIWWAKRAEEILSQGRPKSAIFALDDIIRRL